MPGAIGRTEVAEYYGDPAVRARMAEFCGGAGAHATAAFVAGFDPTAADRPLWDHAPHVPPARLDDLLARGTDVSRSLWDRENLIFFLEIDYLNVDRPAEPFVHPADTWIKLEAPYRAVTGVLDSFDAPVRTFMSGRGYHFTGRIPLDAPVVDALADLAPGVPAWYPSHFLRRPADLTAELSERQARAAGGLGLLTEYVAHLSLERAARDALAPVVFNGTVVGRGLGGRECVSIDFSHLGDPLDIRHVRTAFSAYQWHRLRPDIFGADVAAAVPPLAVVPREPGSRVPTLLSAHGLAAALDAAADGSGAIPEITHGIDILLHRYRDSPLAEFHREFQAARRSPERQTRPSPRGLPPCVAAPLEQPNDLLLKPEFIQHLVRDLMARGWTADQIAALVQDRYEADHGWGDRWQRMHPATRADFDVRVFAGLVATGLDGLVDFNCVSAQEKRLCPWDACRYDLRRDRAWLLDVRRA